MIIQKETAHLLWRTIETIKNGKKSKSCHVML